MYESLIFAKDKKGILTSDINEALKVSEKFVVNPVEIQLSKLKINEDATIKNGEVRKVTKKGFENLCKILGIPKPFAREIPSDLLFHNIKKLQQSNGSKGIILLEREDGEVANIVKSPYTESSYTDVLSHFTERTDIMSINVEESLLTLSLVFREVEIKAPDIVTTHGINKPDTFYVGTWIYNSILKETSLHMESGLFRTLCSNSYIAPFLGKVRANYLKESDDRLLKFTEMVQCYDSDVVERLKTNFDRFHTKHLYDTEVLKIWRPLSRVIGPPQADLLLKIDESTRKEIVSIVYSRQLSNTKAKLLGKTVIESNLTGIKAYDLINDITFFAKDLVGMEKYAVERIGGEWINRIILN